MTTYDLHLESGPKHRKTMVHVPSLPGCVAVGSTTEEACAATPDAIRAYLRFLRRHGVGADPDSPFETRVVEHVTEGDSRGGGWAPLALARDLEPVTEADIDVFLGRFQWLSEELAGWAARQTDAKLAATPEAGGRTARSILLHVIEPTGAYLAGAQVGAPGFGQVARAADRSEMPLADALRLTVELAEERVRATTPAERAAVRDLPAGPRTLRRALRRMLEHPWEHLAELSRRPGGPAL